MERVAFEVPWLHSRECERTVTAALINVPGVEWATAASPTGVVGVQYDPGEADLDELQDAIEAAESQAAT